jgi:predicted negative regulator of RcsB-dependent stress response
MAENQVEPKPKQPVQEHAEDIRNLKELIDTHGKPIAIAVAVALVAVTGIKLYRSHVRNSRLEASRLFGQARSAQDLENLMSRYPSAPTAPLTELRLAKSRFDQADYQAALARYEDFGTRYADHRLAPAAEMGRLCCLEAMGRTEEALRGFADFATRNPQHYLWTQAIFGQGRCLAQVGRTTEARTLYEDFIADKADSAWTPRAEEALELLEQKTKSPPETPAVGALPGISSSDTNAMQALPMNLMPVDFAPAPIRPPATQ